jgi:glycosyltransferase involved in cell wall biosynthesis
MYRVLHINTQFASLGGVEAVLRAHHQRDLAAGIDSRFVAFWEAETPGWQRCKFLSFHPNLAIREARQRVRLAWPGFQPDLVVHHTLWGQPYWQDLDGKTRRVLYLHSDVPDLREKLTSRLPSMDAVMAVSDQLLDRAREAVPHWQAERFHRIYYPVFVPDKPLPSPQRSRSRCLVIGYAGRLTRQQKRVERFIELARLLEGSDFCWRLEFLGDGDERGALERALPNREQVLFHGRKQGDEYWRILASWDVLAFVSDYEGTPIAMLEALSQGVLPLHPALGSGGDQYASSIDPALIYEPGNLGDLASRIKMVSEWPDSRWMGAVDRARRLLEPHAGSFYMQVFHECVQRIAHLPALNKPRERIWGFPTDRFSFSLFERLLRCRRRFSKSRLESAPYPNGK